MFVIKKNIDDKFHFFFHCNKTKNIWNKYFSELKSENYYFVNYTVQL